MNKVELLKEFERPIVEAKTPEKIAENRKSYHNTVANCALSGKAPDDFGNVAAMEVMRGELSRSDFNAIICDYRPEETARINAKVVRLAELGLSWRDL